MVDHVAALPEGTRIMILSPLVVGRKGEQAELIDELRAQGFVRLRIDGEVHEIDRLPKLEKNRKHTLEIVIDRLKVAAGNPAAPRRVVRDGVAPRRRPRDRRWRWKAAASTSSPASSPAPICSYSIPELEPRPLLVQQPDGRVPALRRPGRDHLLRPEARRRLPAPVARGRRDPRLGPAQPVLLLDAGARSRSTTASTSRRRSRRCRSARSKVVLEGSGEETIAFRYPGEKGRSAVKEHAFEGILPNLERRHRETDSIAVKEELSKYLNNRACPACDGTRLRVEARNVRVAGRNIHELSSMPLKESQPFFEHLELAGSKRAVAEKIVREIANRVQFLNNVGLDYLSLIRSADTLSAGRRRGSGSRARSAPGLTGVMYVLDEPSIGLHQRDNERLIETLKRLRDAGNSVIVVEHDEESIAAADHVIDMGPGAGVHGGEVVAQGTPAEILRHPNSLTGQYLSGRKQIPDPRAARRGDPAQAAADRGREGQQPRRT
jgi:excinuclease ABC subunit A